MGQLVSGGWTFEQSEALKAHITAGDSYSLAAAKINGEFGTTFSRNAAIGRANRIGLAVPERPRAPRKKRVQVYKPRARSRQKYSAKANRFYEAINNVETIEIRCAEVIPQHIGLLDLDDDGCRYPFGDSPFTFCNHKKLAGSSYCAPHFYICWLPDRKAVAA